MIWERWSDWGCVSGAKALGTLRVISGSYTDTIDATDACELTIAHDANNPVSMGEVLRGVDKLGVVRWYRVQGTRRTLDAGTRVIKGGSPFVDLATSGRVYTVSGGLAVYDVGGRLTLSEIVDLVITDLTRQGITWFVKGTIDFSGYVSLVAPAEGWTHAEWLRNAREEAEGPAGGCELRIRPNGTTSFLIDLVQQIGSSATPIRVASGRNLLALDDEQDDSEMATAITILGATPEGAARPATIAENAWVLGAIPGAGPYWIPLTDPANAAGPMAFASQFGTAAGSQPAYLLRSDAGLTQVLDSRISPDNAVLVAATTGLTAGHHVQFVADASANRLTELRTPNVRRVHRNDSAPTQRGERNLLRNALMPFGSTTSMNGWTAQGGTLNIGLYSRFVPTSFTGLVVDGAHVAGATTLAVRGFPTFPTEASVFKDESFVITGKTVGGGNPRVGNIVLVPDFAGKATITFLSGTLDANTADGTAVTFFGAAPHRPLTIPSEPGLPAALCRFLNVGSSSALPPGITQLRLESDLFTVKFIAGELALLNASAAFTLRNASGATLGNTDGGGAITEDLSLATTRVMPGLLLLNSVPALLAWSAVAQQIPNNSDLHAVVTCSTTLTADTSVRIALLPALFSTQSLTQLCRWVTLWQGPATQIDAIEGSWGNLLWQRTNQGLKARLLSGRAVRLSLVDLSQLAGYDITREQIVVGGNVVCADLGITVRLVGVTYKPENPLQPDVIVSARSPELTRYLAGLA